MMRSICKHCKKEIGLWFEGLDYATWMHAPDDGPDAYKFCHCKCDACKPDTTLGIHDPCPADCCDGEEAEPSETRCIVCGEEDCLKNHKEVTQ